MRITLRLFALSSELSRSVKMYAQFKPICLSMQQLLDFGAKHHPPKDSFIFLQKELPVRIANIMEEMNLLPPVLLQTPSVIQIRKWYDLTFQEILEFSQLDPDKPKVLERFMTTLKNVKSRHASVVETMAEGVTEMRRELATCPKLLDPTVRGAVDESTMLKMTSTYSKSETLNESVHYFLNRFYMNRIGLNMLVETHLSLFSKSEDDVSHESSSPPESSSDDEEDKIHRLIGCLDPKCDVLLIAENAFDDAQDLCWKHYGTSVDCNFVSYNKMYSGKKIRMTYVPSHLYHMLFELFKNALKTMIDRYEKEDCKVPNIDCLISRGQEDIIIKVSDRGRGIARSDLSNIFQFQCSSSLPPPSPNDENFTISPLSGYGYGLPLSRLYARYFSGDLWLNSIEGFGTDAMIALKADPSEAMEVLPLMTKTASDHYSSHLQVGDWSDSKHFKRNNFIHD